MRKHLILVVDDEPPIVRLVKAKLRVDGYEVLTATRGEEALAIVNQESPDLVVLDVMMPDMDGFETLRRIRQQSTVPVVMLTARGSDMDKLKGLQSGADDYITKPFNPDELEARIAAILRRTAGPQHSESEAVLHYPGLVIDLERKIVTADGEEVRLSRTEWDLLSQLAGNAGRVMMHTELLSRIWGPEYRNETQYLRTWVSRLRAKLEPKDSSLTLITTYPGMGYRFESPPQTNS
ncbi:MAG: response regulator transcription factor [Thermomicrobiales bacterium]|nr:response regulator transcription factor [Thermomicrobiales bacterium]MCO5227372.1 response regulator transcription factor [Thermomicrobiales bacterium]